MSKWNHSEFLFAESLITTKASAELNHYLSSVGDIALEIHKAECGFALLGGCATIRPFVGVSSTTCDGLLGVFLTIKDIGNLNLRL